MIILNTHDKTPKKLRHNDTHLLKILYYFLSFFFIYLFSCYLPFAMEYYINKPKQGFFSYLLNQFTMAGIYSYYEMIILFLIIMALLLLTSRLDLSLGIVSVLSCILTYASNLKYINRLELLNYTDLKLTEAADMAVNYLTFTFDKYAAYLLLFVTFVTLCSSLIRKMNSSTEITNIQLKKKKLTFRLVALFLCAITLCLFHKNYMKTEFAKNPQERFLYFSKNPTDHVIFQFLQNSQTNSSPDEILKSYTELTNKLIEENSKNNNTELIKSELPTIIVIMNESWWNLDYISSEYVSYSIPPMEPLKQLANKCDIGTASVNIYGGGTISSESEFLTGFNTKYFSSTSDIYNILDGKNFPSIVDYFDTLGYTTTAIHPYYSTFYNRENIYVQMGFDNYIFEDDMDYTSLFDEFISDESLVNQIIHEYENNSTNPHFLFSISIASHGMNLDYNTKPMDDYPYPIDISLANNTIMNKEDFVNFNHYVNGIYEANLAFTKLVDYFEKQNSPVVILMFGDHCPNFTTTTLSALGLDVSYDEKWIYSSSDSDTMLNIHTTPVITWNNFSDTPFEMNGENISALCDKLIDYIGLPDTRMTLINKYIRSFLKADTRSHMLSVDGKSIAELTSEQTNAIETLLMIQYDILYGDIVCDNLWEPLK
ncbi:MAG: hypothetical protein E7253_03660 [Lachnospiraceae bacterium]|nr:hypothetical protein [Lachnospiraceae bacterium]